MKSSTVLREKSVTCVKVISVVHVTKLCTLTFTLYESSSGIKDLYTKNVFDQSSFVVTLRWRSAVVLRTIKCVSEQLNKSLRGSG